MRFPVEQNWEALAGTEHCEMDQIIAEFIHEYYCLSWIRTPVNRKI